MRDVAASFVATRERIARRLATGEATDAMVVVEDELRGLFHGLFVIFDGGTSLADEGLVRIVDEDGIEFDRFLHELCFRFWPKENT